MLAPHRFRGWKKLSGRAYGKALQLMEIVVIIGLHDGLGIH
jgi:hypothetical protein